MNRRHSYGFSTLHLEHKDDWLFQIFFVALGLGLAVFRHRVLLDPEQSLFMIKQMACPAICSGDPEFKKVFHEGFYLFGPEIIGRILGALGLCRLIIPVLDVIQAAFWGISIFFFYRLVRRVSDHATAPFLAMLLFSWGIRLFHVTDAPTFPQATFDRSMSLALVLPSIYFYFSGRKVEAWVAGLVSIYLHANPGIYLMVLYFAEDLWEVVTGRAPASDLAVRLTIAGGALLPMIREELHSSAVPRDIAAVASSYVWWSSPVERYVAADWILFFEGIALVAIAWRFFRNQKNAALTARMFLFSLGMFFLGWISRSVMIPLHLPFGPFLVKITAGFAYLFLAEILGLIVVSHALTEALDGEAPNPAAAILAVLCLMNAYRDDFVMMFAAVLLLASQTLGDVARMRGTILGWAVFVLMALWHWQGAAISGILSARLHLTGAIFALPAFGASIAALWAAALAIGVLFAMTLPYTRAFEKMPAIGIFMYVSAAILPAVPSLVGGGDAWHTMMYWAGRGTPADSFFLLPPGEGGRLYEFLIDTERAAFPSDMRYAQVLCEHGAAAAGIIGRLADLGYDFSRLKTLEDIRAEIDRVDRSITRDNLKTLAEKYHVTHVIRYRETLPLPDSQIEYRNADYTVYKL